MRERYFLDTSALLARFLGKARGHAWVQQLCDRNNQNTIVIAEVTEAELAASLNQLVRGGLMRRRSCDRAIGAFWRQVDVGDYHVLPVVSSVIRRAADLCGVHSLKGYDAVQLACAFTYRDAARQSDAAIVAAGGVGFGDPVLLTEDNRLRDAAVAEGFVVDTPLAHP